MYTSSIITSCNPHSSQLCLENTYDYISKKTDEVYDKYGNSDQNCESSMIAYWKKLIFLIVMEIKVDRTFYDPIFNKYG